MKKLADFYLNNALFFDSVLLLALWLANSYLSFFNFKIADKNDNIDIVADTVAASISLAGFILASLTVIASIRSNITNRLPNATRNPLEMFFLTKITIELFKYLKMQLLN